MANVANPRKQFKFEIDIQGVNQFKVQKVTRPKSSVEVVEHGDTNYNVGTAGKIKFDNATLEVIKSSPGRDEWAWDWLMSVQNPETGTGGLPLSYKRNIVVRELDSADNTISTEIWYGCFPVELEKGELDRTKSDNIMDKVVLWVDRVKVL